MDYCRHRGECADLWHVAEWRGDSAVLWAGMVLPRSEIREPVWRHVWNGQRPGPIVVIFAVSPKANWKGIASPFCGEDTVGADHDSDAEPTKEQPASSR